MTTTVEAQTQAASVDVTVDGRTLADAAAVGPLTAEHIACAAARGPL